MITTTNGISCSPLQLMNISCDLKMIANDIELLANVAELDYTPRLDNLLKRLSNSLINLAKI